MGMTYNPIANTNENMRTCLQAGTTPDSDRDKKQ